MDNTDSIYIIEDLVSGKRITTHIQNLCPFIYDPIRTNPLSRSLDIAATAIDDPLCNSTSDGLDSTSPATAGNRTRPSCMWTSSMITFAPTPWTSSMIRRELQQLGTVQVSDACRQAPGISTRTQDAIPDSQRTQDWFFQVRLVFPLRFIVSETSHTSNLLRVSC